MAEVAVLSALGYFMPIFAFLLVFIVIYSLLKSTKILGGSEGVMLFVSLILSSFFVVEASLVEFVRISSSWITVGIFIVFCLLVVMAFVPGLGGEGMKGLGKFLGSEGSNWFAWILLAGIILVFIFSSAYVFNWVINWGMVRSWFDTEWFGMVLLLVIAGIVSWKITK
jgi:hypothetical protein